MNLTGVVVQGPGKVWQIAPRDLLELDELGKPMTVNIAESPLTDAPPERLSVRIHRDYCFSSCSICLAVAGFRLLNCRSALNQNGAPRLSNIAVASKPKKWRISNFPPFR